MFQNPFSFEGRIRRIEFGISFIIFVAVEVILIEIKRTLGEAAILSLINITMLWFLFAQGAKRCHDLGNNGWYQIIPLYVFWMLFVDSNSELNEYGPNPKGK